MKKEELIMVFVKNPGQAPHMEIIQNTLKAFQEIVGGHIEAVTPFEDVALIVNEEGRINGMPFNCWYLGESFFGTMVFVGVDGEEFVSMPGSFNDFKEHNKELWNVEGR